MGIARDGWSLWTECDGTQEVCKSSYPTINKPEGLRNTVRCLFVH